MRIALATPNFPPEFLGGTERVALALAKALRASGETVLVIARSEQPAADGGGAVREELGGIEVRRVRRWPGEVYGLDLRRERVQQVCEDALREWSADVLHVHHWATLSTGLVRGAERVGVPAIVTLHDMWSACPRFFRRPPEGVTCPDAAGREACVECARLGLGHLDERQIRAGLAQRDAELRAELAAARAVTVPSTVCAVGVAAHVPWDGPLEVVPHGLLESVKGHVGPRADDSVLRVGTFGNLVEEKGVMLLVWACRGIPGIELHLHGPFLDAGFEAAVRAQAREFGVELTCHGAYGADETHPARALDVAVFPSLCAETYGLVVEEALARGTPVIVSDRGALAERIGDGGLVVTVDEVGPLNEALRSVHRDRARLDALRAGIPTTFATIADAARRYRELYAVAREGVA